MTNGTVLNQYASLHILIIHIWKTESDTTSEYVKKHLNVKVRITVTREKLLEKQDQETLFFFFFNSIFSIIVHYTML